MIGIQVRRSFSNTKPNILLSDSVNAAERWCAGPPDSILPDASGRRRRRPRILLAIAASSLSARNFDHMIGSEHGEPCDRLDRMPNALSTGVVVLN